MTVAKGGRRVGLTLWCGWIRVFPREWDVLSHWFGRVYVRLVGSFLRRINSNIQKNMGQIFQTLPPQEGGRGAFLAHCDALLRMYGAFAHVRRI